MYIKADLKKSVFGKSALQDPNIVYLLLRNNIVLEPYFYGSRKGCQLVTFYSQARSLVENA